MYLGSWKIDDNLTFVCNTHAAATGAATDADSLPSYRIYEDETGTAILTGSMAKLDDANTTGFYSEQIALSAANGFEKGKCYHVYISATVSSVTGTMSHSFQIEAEVDANRINWANVDNPTTTVGLSGTSIKTATDVETDTADIQSKIGSPAGASVSADIADVESKVDDLETRLGTPSNLGSGATIAANLIDIESQTDDIPAILEDTGTTLPGTLSTIESKIDTIDGIVDNILTDTAEIGAGGAGLSAIPWNTSWDAEVQSEVQDAIEANHLDHLLATDYDPANKPGVATALFNELIEDDAGVSRFTANALEQAPSGSGVGDWTSEEKKQIRYRLQLDGTQAAPAVNSPLQLPVSADAISQDMTAADNWEAMLDGTGGTEFKPGKVTIHASSGSGLNISGNDGAMNIDGSILFGGDIYSDQFLEAIAKRVFLQEFWPPGYFGENTVGERLQRIPNAAPGSDGGLPTVNANNQVAGVSGNVVGSVGSVVGNVAGSIGSLATQAKADVKAEMDSALADYDGPTKAELDAGFATLNDISPAEVLAEINTALDTAIAEPTAPFTWAQASIRKILGWIGALSRNRMTQTGSTTTLRNDANSANIATFAVSDDGTTFVSDEAQ